LASKLKQHTFQTDNRLCCQWSHGSPDSLPPIGTVSANNISNKYMADYRYR